MADEIEKALDKYAKTNSIAERVTLVVDELCPNLPDENDELRLGVESMVWMGVQHTLEFLLQNTGDTSDANLSLLLRLRINRALADLSKQFNRTTEQAEDETDESGT